MTTLPNQLGSLLAALVTGMAKADEPTTLQPVTATTDTEGERQAKPATSIPASAVGMKPLWFVLLATIGSTALADAPSAGTLPALCADQQRAQGLANRFLSLIDDAQYEAAWESTTSLYRTQQQRETWLQAIRDGLAQAGKPRRHQLFAFRQTFAAAPHQGTQLAVFDYTVTVGDGSSHGERIMVGALPAEECGVVHYQIDFRRIALNHILDEFLSNLNRAGGRFDYSDDSLIEIERVLIEHAPGGTPRAKQTKGADYRAFIHFLGQYLGEIIVRGHGGHWSHTPNPEYKVRPWVVMPDGRRLDPYQMVADYARQPAIGTLRQAFERERAASAAHP